jgi:hypothetical protein
MNEIISSRRQPTVQSLNPLADLIPDSSKHLRPKFEQVKVILGTQGFNGGTNELPLWQHQISSQSPNARMRV